MDRLDDLKKQRTITRQDIADLMSSIGKPGEKHDEKLAALEELGRTNRQGHSIALTAESYAEY